MALSDGLQGYWKFNESSGNASGSSLNGNTLTNNNSTAYVSGLLGNAADFELSSSNSFSITDGSQSGLDITGDISIQAWIKLEQLPSTAGSDFTICAKYETTGDERAYRLYVGTDNRLSMQLSSDGTYNDTTTLLYLKADTIFGAGDIGNFRHVVWTWDASSGKTGATCYLNDISTTVTQTGSANPTSIHDSSGPFYAGATSIAGSPGTFFDGLIDELAVWDRIVTSGEVTSLYNSGSGTDIDIPTPSNVTKAVWFL
jgi:hypothetical protein